jgi:hypothetical protein
MEEGERGGGREGEGKRGGGSDMVLNLKFWAAEVVSKLASPDTRYVSIKLNTKSDMRL